MLHHARAAQQPKTMRLRGGGCGPSKPEFTAEVTEEPAEEPARTVTEERVKLKSDPKSFASENSPLFKEYLGLLGETLGEPTAVGEIGPGDALLVIDMQRDFVPKSSSNNPDGGRFGVAEGDHIVPFCEQLISHFVQKGAYVMATRDYHPCDHASFVPQGGPFPAHCVQGSDPFIALNLPA